MATDTTRDLQLDNEGDLDFEEGRLVLTRGVGAIVQAIEIALQFFRGEWFLDESAGVPYFQSVLVKNPDPNLLQSIFRTAILGVVGVLEVKQLDLTFDRAARTLSVFYKVNSDVGELEGSTELQ